MLTFDDSTRGLMGVACYLPRVSVCLVGNAIYGCKCVSTSGAVYPLVFFLTAADFPT